MPDLRLQQSDRAILETASKESEGVESKRNEQETLHVNRSRHCDGTGDYEHENHVTDAPSNDPESSELESFGCDVLSLSKHFVPQLRS